MYYIINSPKNIVRSLISFKNVKTFASDLNMNLIMIIRNVHYLNKMYNNIWGISTFDPW